MSPYQITWRHIPEDMWWCVQYLHMSRQEVENVIPTETYADIDYTNIIFNCII